MRKCTDGSSSVMGKRVRSCCCEAGWYHGSSMPFVPSYLGEGLFSSQKSDPIRRRTHMKEKTDTTAAGGQGPHRRRPQRSGAAGGQGPAAGQAGQPDGAAEGTAQAGRRPAAGDGQGGESGQGPADGAAGSAAGGAEAEGLRGIAGLRYLRPRHPAPGPAVCTPSPRCATTSTTPSAPWASRSLRSPTLPVSCTASTI